MNINSSCVVLCVTEATTRTDLLVHSPYAGFCGTTNANGYPHTDRGARRYNAESKSCFVVTNASAQQLQRSCRSDGTAMVHGEATSLRTSASASTSARARTSLASVAALSSLDGSACP